MLNSLIYIKKYMWTLLPKTLYKDSLKIRDIFWYVKMEIVFLEKTKKQETENERVFYTTTIFFFK